MQLFYNPTLSKTSKEIVFDKKESGHIIKVLRKKIGDNLNITNGKGILFSAVIKSDNHNKCIAEITEYKISPAPDYRLHLVVAPTKRNERFEWFLEKATEIGLSEITPIICEHSERRKVNIERFERVVQSALKQSLQTYIPQVNPAISFKDFIAQQHLEERYIAHCEEDQKILLRDAITPKTDVEILIGPEGDFSRSEIETALKHHFKPVSLGHNRLRTETAALAACHTVALLNQ